MGDHFRHTEISELWLIPLLGPMLQQFPFVIRGFHSDNGSEFINYTVAKAAGKAFDPTNQVPPFRRQRISRSQERRRDS
jgi:hypothetical protein